MREFWYVKNTICLGLIHLRTYTPLFPIFSRFTEDNYRCGTDSSDSGDISNAQIGMRRFHRIDHPSNPWLSDKKFFFEAFDTALDSPISHQIKWDFGNSVTQVFNRKQVEINFQTNQFVSVLAIVAFQIDIMIDITPLQIKIGETIFDFSPDQDPYIWIDMRKDMIFRNNTITIISEQDENFEGLKSILIFPVTSFQPDFYYLQLEVERWAEIRRLQQQQRQH